MQLRKYLNFGSHQRLEIFEILKQNPTPPEFSQQRVGEMKVHKIAMLMNTQSIHVL